jgi:two-component system response regulator RegX3
MARVLVVERHGQARSAALFASEGIVVFTAIDEDETRDAIRSFDPELVVVEAATPTEPVVELCRNIRAKTASPLVLLSGPCAESDAVAAYGAGVDTVVLEPVGRHELVARARAMLRRRPVVRVPDDDTISIGLVSLDTARRQLRVGDTVVAVPRREFDIAEVLMRNVGRVVPRAVIVRELWGSMRGTKSLDVQVGRLRARLLHAGAGTCIVTVRGVGFRFVSGDLEVDDEPTVTIDLVALEQAGAGERDAQEAVGEPAAL